MVKCPNEGCKETMENRYFDVHVQNTCDYRLQTCENCEAQVAHANIEGYRADLANHNSDYLQKHIQLMVEYNSKSVDNATKMEEKIKNLESDKDRLGRQIQESREVVALTKQDFQTLQMKVGIMEKHLDQQKNNLAQIRQTLQSLQNETESETAVQSQMMEIVSLVQDQEKRLNELNHQEHSGVGTRSFGYASSSQRRLDRNEHMCATNEVMITEHDLRLQMLEATSYDGCYMWKIDDWSRRVHEAQIGKTVSLYSPPFYVGRFGYKVCGRLYPCGDGIGKGTHVSMFFVVMKGEFDSLLPWPFRQKITFKLIDPSRTNDISDSFRPEPNSSSFQKPKSSMNVASGTPKFALQTTLRSGGYIVDNTLFIKISVDRTGLVEL
ncbi:hypothetical protein QZH41_012459 [Actinostola sp. cb2023]|nr:hypothetical protein QZH41_012459 [Actinostola sp. cb2023]